MFTYRRAAAHCYWNNVISAGVRGQRSRKVSWRWACADPLQFSRVVSTARDAYRQISMDTERLDIESISENQHHFTTAGWQTRLLELNFDLWRGHPVIIRSGQLQCFCDYPQSIAISIGVRVAYTVRYGMRIILTFDQKLSSIRHSLPYDANKQNINETSKLKQNYTKTVKHTHLVTRINLLKNRWTRPADLFS